MTGTARVPPAAIPIGRRLIGPGHPAFLVAEIGINHDGDLDLARRMIDAAAEAGADSVKFQNYRTEDFIRDRTLTYRYESGGKRVEETQYAMFKRCEMDEDFLVAVSKHCHSRGLVFHSTPTNPDGVRQLVRLGAPVLKNGSDYLTNLDLITEMARTGLPVVLSTGMATQDEVDDAVRAVRAAGNEKMILLHCTSAYPTPLAETNLRRIPSLASAFACLSGFSDHTEGITAAMGAIALGANWIEKHFTTDRSLPGPDHRYSSDPAEFSALARAIRSMEAALGSDAIVPTPAEAEGRLSYRLSCVAARDLEGGAVISDSDVVLARPGTGFPPASRHELIGRQLAKRVPEGQPFISEDFI